MIAIMKTLRKQRRDVAAKSHYPEWNEIRESGCFARVCACV